MLTVHYHMLYRTNVFISIFISMLKTPLKNICIGKLQLQKLMLKFNKFVVTGNQLLFTMLFYKGRNVIHAFEGAHLHQDKYTGKLHHNKNNTDTDYNDAIELLLENEHHLGEIILSTHNKKSLGMIYRYDNDEKCFHASLMGFDEKIIKEGYVRKRLDPI